ncbi:anhydro-N-acetylmuramic acid kinase [Winogradskyella alexanderae]|uniref:Anhydro-N-acetylmuramic acid kinase n=1 Tax=Winogradskyella alexanderae TaxID=2877123 RepID=A0ABS7XU53_9FLAO|nr:anhydro-N-acetylmuramic acid kinase [Winogradskyella alexanderae]MCA0133562.1 anhydro-N-acetylmuramic acid kinase [Winogradskyella alexanderae]
MINSSYNVIGVMSGTSLDGIDLAYVKFEFSNSWNFEIKHCETVSYSKQWVNKLKSLIDLSEDELNKIDSSYTKYLGFTIKDFIARNNLVGIDFVSSHGHTALHKPDQGLTYQIGNNQELADIIGNKIICDFRTQDVTLGGQGAPLVPIGDKLLFGVFDYCLNLGGFANISFQQNNQRIAFDICPVNIVLNHIVSKIGLDYDKNGELASSGKVNSQLLSELNNLPFYNLTFPKSLGLEWVKQEVFPLIKSHILRIEDVQCTLVEHIAIQISDIINVRDRKVLVTGGGAYNTYLISRIKHYVPAQIIIPENNLVEFKEALIFAFLGVLKARNEANCLASVTGAKRDHSSGRILYPKPQI